MEVTSVVTLRPGETVTWRASWSDCGDHAVCGDGHCDVDERLSLSVPNSSLNTCRSDRLKPQGCGRTSDDPGTDVHTGFTAPDTTGPVWLWLVLRDDRGGIGWQGWQVQIQP